MLETLVHSIQTKVQETKKLPFVIAISGFGGSGKSTLASQIKGALIDAEIVCMDSFIKNQLSGRSEDWEDFDRDRLLKEVLIPAQQGGPITYGVYDWKENSITQQKTVSATKFLIVEGCSILHPQLLPYYNYSIWMNISLEEATQRGMKRDQLQGTDHSEKWLKIWMPNEHDFFQKYRPDKAADFIT